MQRTMGRKERSSKQSKGGKSRRQEHWKTIRAQGTWKEKQKAQENLQPQNRSQEEAILLHIRIRPAHPPTHTHTLTRTFTGIDTDASDSKEQGPPEAQSSRPVATNPSRRNYLSHGYSFALARWSFFSVGVTESRSHGVTVSLLPLCSLHRLPVNLSVCLSLFSPIFAFAFLTSSVRFSSIPALSYLTFREKHLEKQNERIIEGLGPLHYINYSHEGCRCSLM